MTIDRNALLERLSESDIAAVYRALGVEAFKSGGDGNWADLLSVAQRSQPLHDDPA